VKTAGPLSLVEVLEGLSEDLVVGLGLGEAVGLVLVVGRSLECELVSFVLVVGHTIECEAKPKRLL
jgi:hypothetical protein